METDRILYDIQLIEDIKEKCMEEGEDRWVFSCECLLKLEHLYFKIENTEMVSFVRQILSPIFSLAAGFFSDLYQDYCAADLESAPKESYAKRIRILDAVEYSLAVMGEAAEVVIQSTNGADRMLVQSAPIDTGGLLYTAPKLCAYYSTFLNELIKIFSEKEKIEYAFCVYPSLVYRPKAYLLFYEREKRGKIGVIRIPNRDIMDVEYLRILILHEFFHIVSKGNIRQRKLRAKIYFQILLYDLSSRIFENTELSLQEMNTLETCFYMEFIEKVEAEFKDSDETDHRFYSSNLQSYYGSRILEFLRKIATVTREEICTALYDLEKEKNFQKYMEKVKQAEKLQSCICGNAVNILANNTVFKICQFYMDVFREVFSDLASILTLNVSPEQWMKTFRHKIVNKMEKRQTPLLYARLTIVPQTLIASVYQGRRIAPCTPTLKEYDAYSWNSRVDMLRQWKKWAKGSEMSSEDPEQKKGHWENASSEKVSVLSNSRIMELYVKYLSACMQELLFFYEEQNKPVYEDFKKRFLNVREGNILDFVCMRQWELENRNAEDV